MSGIGVGLLHLSCGRQKATLGSFSGAGFWTGWAWILLGFGCFGSVPNGGRSCHRSCHCSSIHSSIHYMVFAWFFHAFEAACLVMSGIGRTCWCSGVSEPDQSIVFYGFQRWRERVFWHVRFAWRVLLVFGCFGTGPTRVFRNRTKALFFIVFYGFQRWRERVFWHGCFGTGPKQCLFFMGSKGDVKEFFGMRLAWRVLASCWCSGVSEPDLLMFGCFGTGPKHCFL